ncbi:MAG: hypothetical protein ACR2G7_06940 [Acidimicrobiales bacterium]
MAFGQQSGPPATARQMKHLTELLLAAGHTDFRDARGPLGLTQRQAGGRFTHDEADALVARLEAEAEAGTQVELKTEPGGASPGSVPSPVFNRVADERIKDLHKVPDEALAAELQRRGWIVMEP